jgi:phosphomethylpyrimidine synthase
MKHEKTPDEQVISRTPFPASKKIFVKGQLHDIQVAMREITLSDTKIHNGFGATEPNPPVTIYDTSGPYTDPNADIDVKRGLPKLRESWITDRKDVEQLDHISSDYGQERLADPKLNELRFAYVNKPYKATPGSNVSQMHYAKKESSLPKWNTSPSGKTKGSIF